MFRQPRATMKYLPYIIIVILLFLLAFMFQRLNRLSSMVDNRDAIIAEKNDSLSYERNKYGRLVAEKLAVEASYKEIRDAYPRLAAELKNEFDVKIKDLKAYVKNTIEASGSGNAVVHNHYTLPDSTGKRYPYWELKASDGYLDFSADVIDSLHAPYRYTYTDTITTVVSTRKKWLFGKETLHASTSLRNPNAKVSESTNILINKYKDKRWIVYAGVGYGATFTKDQFLSGPTMSVGVGYAFVKF